MTIHVDPSDPRPIYLQIVDEVRRARVVGTLKADDPLPSTRQLAAELRVNPNTVQQAYRELERDGVVYVKRGMGTFVAAAAGGAARRERQAMARAVAERALRDAWRHGLTVAELATALAEAAAPGREEEP